MPSLGRNGGEQNSERAGLPDYADVTVKHRFAEKILCPNVNRQKLTLLSQPRHGAQQNYDGARCVQNGHFLRYETLTPNNANQFRLQYRQVEKGGAYEVYCSLNFGEEEAHTWTKKKQSI